MLVNLDGIYNNLEQTILELSNARAYHTATNKTINENLTADVTALFNLTGPSKTEVVVTYTVNQDSPKEGKEDLQPSEKPTETIYSTKIVVTIEEDKVTSSSNTLPVTGERTGLILLIGGLLFFISLLIYAIVKSFRTKRHEKI